MPSTNWENRSRESLPWCFIPTLPWRCIDYSEAIEEEGTFGEVAKNSWRRSQQSWQEFGDREVPTTYNISIHLNDYERLREKAHDEGAALDALLPGVRERIREERIAAFPPEDREIWDMPADKRDETQAIRTVALENQIKPTYLEIAQRGDTANQLEALRLADSATRDEWMAGVIDRYRDIVNFKYWRLHCEAEQTPDALAAHKAIYDGEHAFRASDLDSAKKQYDEGLNHWRAVLDAFPLLMEETIVIDELVDVIDQYRKLLDQLDIDFPETFVLQDVLDKKNASPYPSTKSQPPSSTGDVTGPAAESDRGTKKPAPPTEGEPPAAKP